MMRSVRKMLPIYFTVLLLFAAGAYAASLVVTAHSVMMESSVRAPLPVIILDPGHGGADGGAVSPNGVKESALNLEIGLRLRDLLCFLGLPVEMTRETDCSLHSEEAVSLSEQKISDLKNRVRMTEQFKNAILVSIHQNMFSDARYRGAQVFYASSGPSLTLAERLQALFDEKLDPSNHRQAKDCGNVYLLNNAHCPAVLVECGFLSNAREELLLREADYQKKLAAVIAAGLTGISEGNGVC